MKYQKFFLLTTIALLGALLHGCTDSAPEGPTFGLGGATVTKYMAVGNSLTAGYQSGGLFASGQKYSFPNLIAEQLKKAGAGIGTFEQPTWPDPGNPDPATGKAARYKILSLAGPIIGPAGEITTNPSNTTLSRSYDNMGLPGAPLAGFMDTIGTYQGGLGSIIVRASGGFPKSVFRQVAALQPNLITFWLGANDVLGFATSGGVSPSAPTPSATFAALYTQALDTLRKTLPNAKIVVATIPNVNVIPYFTTIGPKIAGSLPAGIYLRYQKHGVTGPSFDSTRFTETTPPLITLKGGAFAGYLGQPSGAWYRALAASLGYPVSAVIGAGIDTTQAFGFHPLNPWPDALVLDAAEQASASSAVTAFNSTIVSVAAAKGAAVFDAYSLINTIASSGGYVINGEIFTTAYVSGGLFSLDGVHPSSVGYALFANEFIKTINKAFNMNVPYVNYTEIPKETAPLAKLDSKGFPVIPFEAVQNLENLFKAPY